jgi:integrase
MAVVARSRKTGIVFFVATHWKGATYFERSGTERREAERLDARRKREVKAGTYQPPTARSSNVTVRQHADRWLTTRNNRSADHDEYLMGVALGPQWFADLTHNEVRPRHVIQLVRELQASRAHKSTTNAISVLSVMFRDAVIEELIPSTPVVLPRGLLRRTFKRTEPYQADQVAKLLATQLAHRALAALAFYTGMRPGEIAGRRWRDWDENAKPLGALSVHSTYDDLPLKGDDGDKVRSRLVPVHPELAAALKEWREHGWPLVYATRPGPDDWILPSRRGHRDRSKPYTKSGIYQLWRAACDAAGVTGRELRATRNTFVTFARRSSPRTDVIESFTHNAAGTMIDRYNRFQWAPRCDVMGALDFVARVDEVSPVSSFTAPEPGLEPGTRRLTAACSTN